MIKLQVIENTKGVKKVLKNIDVSDMTWNEITDLTDTIREHLDVELKIKRTE